VWGDVCVTLCLVAGWDTSRGFPWMQWCCRTLLKHTDIWSSSVVRSSFLNETTKRIIQNNGKNFIMVSLCWQNSRLTRQSRQTPIVHHPNNVARRDILLKILFSLLHRWFWNNITHGTTPPLLLAAPLRTAGNALTRLFFAWVFMSNIHDYHYVNKHNENDTIFTKWSDFDCYQYAA
jgi:hypothetical protein